MKVTDKDFFMEEFLIDKLDLIIKRVTKRKLDAVMVIDGDEGFGKTGLSLQIAYYISQQTGREFNLDRIFFDPNEFMNYVNSTREQIIIWDEAALGGLASGWQNKAQQLIIQTLMTCRFRRHIIIFNCPKFYRLNRYFVLERAMGLCHVYSPDGLNAGKITYYKKEMLERMLDYWTRHRQKPYKKFTVRYLRGGFVDGFNLGIINEDEYDKKKSKYTQKLINAGQNKKADPNLKKLEELKIKIATIDGLTQTELANKLGIARKTLWEWKKLGENTPIENTV